MQLTSEQSEKTPWPIKLIDWGRKIDRSDECRKVEGEINHNSLPNSRTREANGITRRRSKHKIVRMERERRSVLIV
jgi:hypothetical protein